MERPSQGPWDSLVGWLQGLAPVSEVAAERAVAIAQRMRLCCEAPDSVTTDDDGLIVFEWRRDADALLVETSDQGLEVTVFEGDRVRHLYPIGC